jgi:hypothetical protein
MTVARGLLIALACRRALLAAGGLRVERATRRQLPCLCRRMAPPQTRVFELRERLEAQHDSTDDTDDVIRVVGAAYNVTLTVSTTDEASNTGPAAVTSQGGAGSRAATAKGARATSNRRGRPCPAGRDGESPGSEVVGSRERPHGERSWPDPEGGRRGTPRRSTQAGSGTPPGSPPGSSGVASIGGGGRGSGASGSSSAGSLGTGSYGSIGSGSGSGATMGVSKPARRANCRVFRSGAHRRRGPLAIVS